LDSLSPVFCYLYAQNISERNELSKRANLAFSILKPIINEKNGKNLPFIYYLGGKLLSQKGEYLLSSQYFRYFIQISKGAQYKADAALRSMQVLLLAGKTDLALQELSFIKKQPNSITDSDKYAHFFAENCSITSILTPVNLKLLLIKLYTDGGFYPEAEKELKLLKNNIAIYTVDEKVEYYFRYGRFCHNNNLYQEAKYYYRKTIIENPTHNLWIKVYALLYLAQILEKENNLKNALDIYKYCLSFDDYHFKTSVQQKAKAAINRINNINSN
jgi:tetratricopeptide (TPR) repeat protein